MARVGKITVFIDETRNAHTLTVTCVGRKGNVAFNTESTRQQYPYVNSAVTAKAYLTATLNEVIAALT